MSFLRLVLQRLDNKKGTTRNDIFKSNVSLTSTIQTASQTCISQSVTVSKHNKNMIRIVLHKNT